MVGLAAEHHPVAPGERIQHRGAIDETAVDDNRQRRKLTLKLSHDVISKRRNGAILLGR
jgi:hypothetical protein